MPPIPPSLRAARAQWRTCAQHLHASTNPPKTRLYSTTRTLRSSTTTTASNPLRSAARAPRSREQDLARSKRSMYISATGMIVCAVGMYGVIKADVFGLEQTTATTTDGVEVENSDSSATKLDGPSTGFPTKPTLTHIQSASGNPDQVETGTSSIPHFPAVIHLPKWLESEDNNTPASATDLPVESNGKEGEGEEEYHLLGLGIRTVSFLNFQVYVVGLYVAKEDLAELQSRLVRTAVHPPGEGTESVIDNEVGATAATSLVSMEREKLRELLLDAEKGEQAWDVLLKKDGLRTAFRVVPTRNTDFLHLRDGWVRGITGRAQRYNKVEGGGKGEFEGEEFGQAMGEFKGLFGGGQRKSVPKGQVLVLARGKKGQLDVLVQGGGEGKDALPDRYLGRVKDERVSRLVWLNYLAGKNVSSEGARRSVVDGIMGVVERPVGTV